MKKTLLIEIIWIVILLITSAIIAGLVIGFSNLIQPTLNIQLHDTYLLFAPLHLIVIGFVFLPLAFIVFGLRVILNRFRKTIPNIIFLAATALLIVLTTYFIIVLSKLGLSVKAGSWTVYPPLSALYKEPALVENKEITGINNVLMVVQSLLIVVLVISAVMTGMKIKRSYS